MGTSQNEQVLLAIVILDIYIYGSAERNSLCSHWKEQRQLCKYL